MTRRTWRWRKRWRGARDRSSRTRGCNQQLRQSEARFRVALEHAKIAVVETDLERRIRWIYNTRLDVRD